MLLISTESDRNAAQRNAKYFIFSNLAQTVEGDRNLSVYRNCTVAMQGTKPLLRPREGAKRHDPSATQVATSHAASAENQCQNFGRHGTTERPLRVTRPPGLAK